MKILDKIRSLFFQKRISYPKVNFNIVTKAEMEANYTNALNDLFESKEDGFWIKGFLSEDEVNTLNENFAEKMKGKISTLNEGFTFPIVFPEFSLKLIDLTKEEEEEKLKEYFLQNQKYFDTFDEEYGVDIPNILKDFFEKISGGRNVGVAKGVNGTGNYPFTTYRSLIPDKGVITAHCGNFFQAKFIEFYEHLSSVVKVKDQLSFFIVMKQSEIDGELYVYNLRWEEGQRRGPDTSGYEKIILSDGRDIDIDNAAGVEAEIFNPEVGDMILFQGGNIWHKVSTIRGNNNRITFGAFMGLDKQSQDVIYWS